MSSQIQTIQIDDLSHDGRGIGRVRSEENARGKACFVKGALPGETVRWRTTNSKRSFDEGELIEVLEASPDRVTPRCQHIQECGGCELQHLDATAQPLIKQTQLQGLLGREGLTPENWLAPLTGSPWEYRRRTRMSVAFVRGEVVLGYRRRASRKIAQIDKCIVLEPRLNGLIGPLKNLVSGLKPFGLDQIELVAGDTALAICLSVKKMPDDNLLLPLSDFCLKESVQLWVREGRQPPIAVSEYESLETKLEKATSMQFTPAQFVQINADMNRKMIQQSMQLLDLQPHYSALDLFCGAGNFSLPLAKRAGQLLGLEGLPELIVQAGENAQREGLDNAKFALSDLSMEAALSPKNFRQGAFDRVLLDPPRVGAKNLMPGLIRLAAPKLVYISCHPATLARDAKTLVDGGYRLSKVGVMDMFPQTTHLEAMALFER